jgi:hypothetical protein
MAIGRVSNRAGRDWFYGFDPAAQDWPVELPEV